MERQVRILLGDHLPQLQRQPVCPVSVLGRRCVALGLPLAGLPLPRQQSCGGARKLVLGTWLLGQHLTLDPWSLERRFAAKLRRCAYIFKARIVRVFSISDKL